jgi:1-acyl-sn-glycerol-3-phosphate acyltransferase
MSGPQRNRPLEVWLAYWRFWQCYHRYSVEGIERLDGPGAKLIAGYHGRPLAFDMCMLTVALYDRLGYLPHGVVHRGLEASPWLKQFPDALGFVTEDGDELARAVERGEHIVITPGAGREGCRAFYQNYTVNWGDRLGYVRLARRYRLPIVPVAAAGADDTYLGLVDTEALGRRLGISSRWSWALWTGLGPLGLYPFSPPFPVRLRQIVGEPIDPWRDGGSDDDLAIHRRVVVAVQGLLDRALR